MLPSVDWLLYSAIRKEALLTSQIEGTQATLMSDLERFIHNNATDLPPMVKIALAHAQLETIHPFLDGNGRIGRLLISALFEHWGLLTEPLMYLSGYLKQHQSEYYRRLSAIRTEGDWESWVAFFLEGVASAADEAERNIITEMTGQKKNRSYSYHAYVEVLSRS